MSVKPVGLYIDPILHRPCGLVANFNTPELEQLATDLLETMREYKGVGLAANQIGVDKNICVLSIEDKSKQIVVSNIRILRYTKETDILKEGCLSCPGVTVNMERPLGVEFEYCNLMGEKRQMTLEGFDARILFHEAAHLDGKLIINNLMKL